MRAIERGTDWGPEPLWEIELEDGSTVGVHAASEAEAVDKVLNPPELVVAPGLPEAVQAVVSAPDFETAKVNLSALVRRNP
jgi:hypothetical protein